MMQVPSSSHKIPRITLSERTNKNLTFCAPKFRNGFSSLILEDRGQNREETTKKITKYMSYITATQAGTGYFPLFAFFIIYSLRSVTSR
jgi:hypothetical protein